MNKYFFQKINKNKVQNKAQNKALSLHHVKKNMVNILFYGNCQIAAIKETLCLSNNEYNIFHIQCWTTECKKETFIDIIKKCDIIITQPINDNYRGVDYLSTNFIIKHINHKCKIIIFDNCYFNFYYFDLTYKKFNNENLRKPTDYHYNKMIECYNNNYSIEYYIDNYVNNENLKTSQELEEIANNSLEELEKRYNSNKEKYNKNNIYIISISEFIKNNYKNKLLFYSMNHPTKYLIQYICLEIIKILQIPNTINYDIDKLNNSKCIIYKCIQKNVNFDITNHESLLSIELDTISNNYDIIKLYYDTYKSIIFL